MSRKSEGGRRQRGVRKPSRKSRNPKKRRHTLSTEAQSVLSTLLEDVIEKTLEDARKMAEKTGKARMSIEDVENALRKLCQRFRSTRAAPVVNGIDGGIDCLGVGNHQSMEF
ncbi:uncharacterized protein LOC107041147 [Diachasma alloeum]|uniref:uncharacterized protein LOC107041147 n=1 Tax=Diachasma alloeum TaxID=454923 RepID=UPI0007384095|nr:uncharacterized protein LOC107041147 [Diachasma alloeum]